MHCLAKECHCSRMHCNKWKWQYWSSMELYIPYVEKGNCCRHTQINKRVSWSGRSPWRYCMLRRWRMFPYYDRCILQVIWLILIWRSTWNGTVIFPNMDLRRLAMWKYIGTMSRRGRMIREHFFMKNNISGSEDVMCLKVKKLISFLSKWIP